MKEAVGDVEPEFANDRYGFSRSIFRRFVHWASYTFVLKSRRSRDVIVGDLTLHVPPDVFHPGIFVTSRMFADFIRTLDLRGCQVAEVGTGSGILAISAAKVGAAHVLALDINPAAVEAAHRNANANGIGKNFSTRVSNLFSAARADEKFDVIISSPPSFAGEPIDMADRAWHAGRGYSDIGNLFHEAGSHLKPGGKMYLLLSSDSNIPYLQYRAGQAGFDWKLCAEKSILVERFLIFVLNKADRHRRMAG